MAKTKSTRPVPNSAAEVELPASLSAYLADQQTRARELQDILRLIKEDSKTDNGALVVAWRMALELNNALDSLYIERAANASPEPQS